MNSAYNMMNLITVDFQIHGSANVERKTFISKFGYESWYEDHQYNLSYCKVS
jgi:hypothetical protein